MNELNSPSLSRIQTGKTLFHKSRAFKNALRGANSHKFGLKFQKLLQIRELSGLKITPSQQGLKMGELRNPGFDRSAIVVVLVSLEINRQEDLLNDIFSIAPLTEYLPRNSEDQFPILCKEHVKASFAVLLHGPDQHKIIAKIRIEVSVWTAVLYCFVHANLEIGTECSSCCAQIATTIPQLVEWSTKPQKERPRENNCSLRRN